MVLVSRWSDPFSVSPALRCAQRTLSQRHFYLPWLRAVLNPASMCAIIPLPPHSLHTGSSLIPLLWRFIDDGTILYTDWSRKEMRKGSSLQSSGHVIFHFGRAHFIQTPDPSSTALDLSSSSCRTSAWIMSVLCLGTAFPHRFLMMSFSVLSVCASHMSAAHLSPDLIGTPALLTFIQAHVATSPSAFMIHLTCTWVEVMVRPSLLDLIKS